MDRDPGGSSASSHLIVGGHRVDPQAAREVAVFRKAERARLMNLRRSIPASDRASMTATLARSLDALVAPGEADRIAVYWPIRGEPDLRGWISRAHAAGATILLPVVTAKAAPLIFREWGPGRAMERGFWNIPVPADGRIMSPNIVVSPLLGVDDACFRLGNGGGYYDRTLAGLAPPPRVIGVGFADCRMPTIFPMPWDVPMDVVVLADGRVRHR